ncbi:uncharacterized protein LOC130290937 [Hyla sarda]|uniref:uncharacterized protein LOC130290937 n=1 Tax=Hyla sarda TaxID=327740 RepID=UPI0024C26875|nr:uncharacterized protein LOC130290937 [Hyla sarda]
MESTTGKVPVNHASSFSNADIGRILGAAEGDMSFLHVPTNIDLQRQYEYESRRLLSLTLHLSTLGEYYKSERIPRGMRLQPRENAYMGNPEYRQRYELLANRFSLDLILLNMDMLQKDIVTVKDKLTNAETTLKSILSEEDFDKFISKHSVFLQKLKNEVENTKRHKWYRDSTDYSNSRTYMWGSQSVTRRSPRKTRDTKLDSKDRVQSTTNDFPSSNTVTQDFLDLHQHTSDAPPGEEANATNGNTRNRQRTPRTTQNRHKKK